MNPVVSVLNVIVNRVNNEAKIEFIVFNIPKINFERLQAFLPVVSREWKIENNVLKAYTKTSIIFISESGRVTVWSKDLEICQYMSEIVLKVIYLSHFCIQCGECVASCPKNALDISQGYPRVVNLEECDLCKNCIKACPIAKYYGMLFSREVELKLVQ